MKSFKETGNLLNCVRTTIHHSCWSKFPFAPTQDAQIHGRRRAESIEDALKKILARMVKIKEVAKKTNNTELMQIFEETFEFGL